MKLLEQVLSMTLRLNRDTPLWSYFWKRLALKILETEPKRNQ